MRIHESRQTGEWPSTKMLKAIVPLLAAVVVISSTVHGLPPAANFALGCTTGFSIVSSVALLLRLTPEEGPLRSRLGRRDHRESVSRSGTRRGGN